MTTSADRLFGSVTGQPMSVAEARLALQITSGLSQRGTQNLNRFVAGVETRAQNQKDDAVRRVESLRDEIAEQIEDDVDGAKAEARRIERAVRSGQMTADEGRRQAAQVADVLTTANKRLEQLFKTDDDLRDLAEMDPADYEADLLEKYPALRRSLPVLTEEELNRAD